MAENKLKDVDGKKIRRQYFNIPLVILYTLMFAIPYAVFTISLCIGKFDPAEWPSTLWILIWVGFCFSLPFLILRTLNKFLFGRIICVLTKEGIHYPKGMLRWETVEKIEYAVDAKPRYQSDPAKAFRAIIYTQGRKHVVLPSAPLCLLSRAKKYKKELAVKIAGVTSLLPLTAIMAMVIFLCPFYVVLLVKSPGASVMQLIAVFVIGLVLMIVMLSLFDARSIEYRFWRRILPRKWLFYTILWCYYLSFFAFILVLSYFPNWAVVSLFGIYLGIAESLAHPGAGRSRIPTYEQMYGIYIKNADLWEKNIKKAKKKRENSKRGIHREK